MRRRIPLIALAVLLAAAAWGWRGSVVDLGRGTQAEQEPPATTVALSPPASPVQAQPAPAGTIAAASPAPAPAAAASERKAGTAPTFDVVRVEPNGSTIVAGRAVPGGVVTLNNGATNLAQTTANAAGDFVLDLTLPTGEHRLRLSDASRDLSADAAVVSVPPAGRPQDLLVMMDRPGQPTQILASPKPAPETVPSEPVETEVASVARAPTPPGTRPAANSSVAPSATLGVEAVEVENKRLSVAGAAPEGSRLNIYLDDKLVGQAGGTQDDRFIANAMADVSVGQHVVRIDEVKPDGSVAARAEVPFTRPDENSMAAIAPSAASVPAAQAKERSTETLAPAGRSDATKPAVRVEADAASSQPADVGANPPTVLQPALEATQAKVIIRRGDSLWRISRRAYGQGVRYTVIYLANGDQIRDPDRIYPGQVFRMPDDEGRPPRT